MARGNETIVSSQPNGKKTEGIVKTGETHYPGMVVEIDPTVALVQGRHTYKIFAGSDGENPLGAIWVVTNELNAMIGKLQTEAYAAGERMSLYSPMAGDELNMLVKNETGTADDHSAGEKLMVDGGTGMLIPTTSTPENEPFVLLEAITDPTTDTLAWCQYGH